MGEPAIVNQRRNILYLTNRLPYPPDKGDRIRTFHQIDRLALSHNVYCATFVENERDALRVRHLRRWCRGVIAVNWNRRWATVKAGLSLLRGRTFTHGAYASTEMTDRIARLSQKVSFDAVVCFSSIMAPYLDAIDGTPRSILDLCDVDSGKWADYAQRAAWPKSWVYGMEARRLRKYEQKISRTADVTTVITQGEKQLLKASDDAKVRVVPNGVHPASVGLKLASRCGPVVSFLGSMNYAPNAQAVEWFADKIWPVVYREHPQAQFLIVGREPTRAVRRLDGRNGIQVTGSVKDTLPYVDRSRICVAPLQIARGLPNKILEAMAAGRPVVATPKAAACVNAEHGQHLLIGGDESEFARHVCDLLSDDEMVSHYADAGRTFVSHHYDWQNILDDFEAIVTDRDVAIKRDAMIVRTQLAAGILPASVVLPDSVQALIDHQRGASNDSQMI